MRSTEAMEHTISESVQTFSEKIPDSEDWLKKIDIILVFEPANGFMENAPEHDCGVSLVSFRQRQVLPDLYNISRHQTGQPILGDSPVWTAK